MEVNLNHYSNKHQILLVGEGDFSFSLCLARAFGSATNITATSLDTREELELKYKNAKRNVEELESLGCTVVHGVNVHFMKTDSRRIDGPHDTHHDFDPDLEPQMDSRHPHQWYQQTPSN